MTTGLPIRGVRLRIAAALLIGGLMMSGCGGAEEDELLVFAAASLTESFVEIEAAFEAANPGVDVALNFAGSSALREQVIAGAPADVLATANHNDLFAVDEAGLLTGTPELFATNELQVAVPAGNPAGVVGLEDFANEDLRIGLCATPVPCGGAAEFMLTLADVEALPDTREPDVKSLATKLVDGELDAGLIYATDIEAANGALEHIPLDANLRSRPVVYAIVDIAGASESPNAQLFVDFVMSETGQRILVEHGFGGAR